MLSPQKFACVIFIAGTWYSAGAGFAPVVRLTGALGGIAGGPASAGDASVRATRATRRVLKSFMGQFTVFESVAVISVPIRSSRVITNGKASSNVMTNPCDCSP
jgi:hypothetical protein